MRHLIRAPFVPLVIAALAVMGSTGCGEPDVDLQVDVVRAAGATFLTPPALRVLVRAQCQQPESWGPYALDEENQRYFINASVPADTPFTVDIWGCSTTTSCDVLTARGCALIPDGLGVDEDRLIAIEMRDFDEENDPCRSLGLDSSTCGVGP
jgi:hypothetical protein